MEEKLAEATDPPAPSSPRKYKGIFSAEPKLEALTEFHIFESLPPELHYYILAFCTTKQLFNFAQCSSMCNMAIQRFNTAGPHRISVIHNEETEQRTCVQLRYKYAYNRPFEYICEPLSKSEFGFTEAAKIIENAMKLVKSFDNNVLDLDVPYWPKSVVNIEPFKKLQAGRFTMTPPMLKDFVEFLDQSQMKRLVLEPTWNSWELPAKFFKSPGFRRLDCAVLKMDCNIEEQDFLSSTARVLHIRSTTVDGTLFNKKILQWFENHSKVDVDYKLYNKKRNSSFTWKTISNGLPFIENGSEYEIRRADGLVGRLHIAAEVKFSTKSFNEYELVF